MRHGMLQWTDVLARLQQMSKDQLEDTATVRQENDEFFGVRSIGVSASGDAAEGILDPGHIYLDVNEKKSLAGQM